MLGALPASQDTQEPWPADEILPAPQVVLLNFVLFKNVEEKKNFEERNVRYITKDKVRHLETRDWIAHVKILKIISTFKNNIKVLKVERKELPFFFNILFFFQFFL